MFLNRTEYEDNSEDANPRSADGILYEPRALWEMQSVTVTAETGSRVVQLDKTNFYNSSRHTLVLNKFLMAPVGYIFREYNNIVVGPGSFQNCETVLQRYMVSISAPFRQDFSRRRLFSSSLCALPTQTPGTRYMTANYASSLWGLTRWTFEKPMALPRRGVVQFDLSVMSRQVPPTINVPGVPQIDNSIVFHEGFEAGGRWMGNSRMHPVVHSNYAQNNNVYPGGAQPVPFDNFAVQTIGGGQQQSSMWDPNSQFGSQLWREQEANRGGGRSWINGFSVCIDQTAYDEYYQTDPAIAGFPIAQFANRCACRARSVECGTNEWWWRPGAPLSLVCPTITPAQVHEFDQPITLAPGESLSIVVEFPADLIVAQQHPTMHFNLGVSLTGYAMVEG